MSDSIVYRKDVYNALVEKGQVSKRYKLGEEWELNGKEIREALENVPSVESGIIYCKDCKWFGRVDKRRFYRGSDCLRDHLCSIVPDRDFCSRVERREEEE